MSLPRILGVAAAVGAVMVVLLARQNADLRAEHQAVWERAFRPYPSLFVPNVELPLLGGGTEAIGERDDGRRQLVFYFTTTCPFCLASIPEVRRLAEALGRADPAVRFVGMSLDSLTATQAYVEEHDIRYPVGYLTSYREQHLLRAYAVSQLVLISPRGQVLWNREGVVVRAAVDSALAAARAPDAGLRSPNEAGDRLDPDVATPPLEGGR